MKKVILIFSILLIMSNFVKLSQAQEKEIIIDIEIIPHSIITEEYNVVGDIFHYNFRLFNNFSEEYNDTFTIEIFNPHNRSIYKKEVPLIIQPQDWINITPYINKSKNMDVKILPFEISGDYTIKICSTNQMLKFIKNYVIKKEGFLPAKSYYYSYGCFTHYFSVMPEWQYRLFKEELSAAKESLSAAKESLSAAKESLIANQKLINLTVDLDNATNTMKDASIAMLIVALITLYVASTKEEDKKSSLFKVIRFLSKLIVLFLIIYAIGKILIFLGII